MTPLAISSHKVFLLLLLATEMRWEARRIQVYALLYVDEPVALPLHGQSKDHPVSYYGKQMVFFQTLLKCTVHIYFIKFHFTFEAKKE